MKNHKFHKISNFDNDNFTYQRDGSSGMLLLQ